MKRQSKPTNLVEKSFRFYEFYVAKVPNIFLKRSLSSSRNFLASILITKSATGIRLLYCTRTALHCSTEKSLTESWSECLCSYFAIGEFMVLADFISKKYSLRPRDPGDPEGPQVPQVPQGPQGPHGPEDPEGLEDSEGSQDPQGPKGPQGPEGPQDKEGQEGSKLQMHLTFG